MNDFMVRGNVVVIHKTLTLFTIHCIVLFIVSRLGGYRRATEGKRLVLLRSSFDSLWTTSFLNRPLNRQLKKVTVFLPGFKDDCG